MTRARFWHIAIGVLTVGAGIATELLTTGMFSHAPWAATALVVVSFIRSEIATASAEPVTK